MTTPLLTFALLLLITGCGGGANDVSQSSDSDESAIDPRPGLFLGNATTCLLASSGELRCWGLDTYGQLGSSSAGHEVSEADSRPIPLDAALFSTSGSHSCAVTRAGAVHCWGDNSFAQLGFSEPTMLDGPGEPVESLPSGNIQQIVTGARAGRWAHSCVLYSGTGEAWCWGDSTLGQLGYLSTKPLRPSRVPLDDIRQLASGDDHICALKADGGVTCWGNAGSGALGNDSFWGSLNFTPVSLPRPAVSIQAAPGVSCAVLDDGSVRCWGRNPYGQLGTGDRISMSAPSMAPAGLLATAELALGFSHSCSLSTTGEVRCWGDNSSGQLGYQNLAAEYLTGPLSTPLSFDKTPMHIFSGWTRTCVMFSDESYSCWP